MESTVKLYSLNYSETRTYLTALFFVAGNVVLPQLFHLFPSGGTTWLPIYFFTLIGAYKYGWKAGLLTSIASPLVNSWLFGMPAPAVLPAILMKSLLLAAGAGFAQYANVLVAILQNWISSSYGETMTKITSGKSLFMMIFWMGIIAPVAEEMIFRWLIYLRLRDHFSVLFSAVISAAFFGIYHGNVLQAVYAFVLGGIFAWFLEMGGNKWTSVLMHIGANTWILIFSEYAQTLVEKAGAGSLHRDAV